MSADPKPLVSVGTFGDRAHGKTTVTNALVARWRARANLPKSSDAGSGTGMHWWMAIGWSGHGEGDGPLCRHEEYETASRRYAHIDAPCELDWIKEEFLASPRRFERPGGRLDGAILVVATDRGLTPRARQAIRHLRLWGVPRIIPFLNKVELAAGPELLDLAEWEVREALHQEGFLGDEVPVVRGSALAAEQRPNDEAAGRCIDELMAALDDAVPSPKRPQDEPFLMPVEDVFSIKSRGTVVSGRIERGRVKIGDAVEIVGLMKGARKTVVTGVEMFARSTEYGTAGDHVGLLLRLLNGNEIERGQVLARPGSITPHTAFEASVYVLGEREGGGPEHFPCWGPVQLVFHFSPLPGTVELADGALPCQPGELTEIVGRLGEDRPAPLEEGTRFVVRQGERTKALGRVSKVLG